MEYLLVTKMRAKIAMKIPLCSFARFVEEMNSADESRLSVTTIESLKNEHDSPRIQLPVNSQCNSTGIWSSAGKYSQINRADYGKYMNINYLGPL